MFNKQNFCHVASNNRNEQKAGIFVYKTTDDLDTVRASGYFNEKIIDINLHDFIIHEWHDANDRTKVQYNLLCVTERTLDNVGTTVIHTKWDETVHSTLEAISQVLNEIPNTYVKVDGTSIMSAPLKFRAGSLRGGIGPSFGGVELYTLNNDDTLSLVPVARITTSAFTPHTDNAQDVGSTTRKWKTLYIGALNNGYDITVPVTAQAETLALKSEVDLAANSGRMITDEGVWYAKMDAQGTIPAEAEVEGRNYADFTQVDGNNDPIIVIYTYTSGSWTQTETITPPAAYDGYVPVTSKIWDIPEQTGQQGGRILWNHQSKEFTPYPLIVSFEDIHVTGDSTVVIPANPGNNQIVNKDYVDNAISSIPSSAFDLFDIKWRDATTSNTAWALSDGNWKTDTNGYNHLANDYDGIASQSLYYITIYLIDPDTKYYRDNSRDVAGEAHPYAYTSFLSTTITTVYMSDNPGDDYIYDGPTSSATAIGLYASSANPETIKTPEIETVAGTNIAYYTAADGHKIITPDQETNADAIYAATGVAWYYILDTNNNRYKLPRTEYAFVGSRGNVGKYVAPGLPNITGAWNDRIAFYSAHTASGAVVAGTTGDGAEANVSGTNRPASYSFDASKSNSIYGASTTVQAPATQMYLYFYIG